MIPQTSEGVMTAWGKMELAKLEGRLDWGPSTKKIPFAAEHL